MQLNTAYAWSARFDVACELVIHWEEPEDWLYHPDDVETVCERIACMQSKMHERDRVTVEHVWNSTEMFSFANSLMNDQYARFKLKPQRYFLESQESNTRASGTHFPLDRFWYSDWQYVDAPYRATSRPTIAYWDPHHNAGDIKDYKDVADWGSINLALRRMFPEYEVRFLTYRDSFETAYKTIQGADFCVGYDGMWHYVARNMGKHFISLTGDICLPLHMTTPNEALFCLPDQFWDHLSKMRDPEFRELMINYSHGAWRRRLKNILDTNHDGYVAQTLTYIQMLDEVGLGRN